MRINAKNEVQACNKIVEQLDDYRNRNWAIGMTGDTLQPDVFLAFFTGRQLPFRYYVRSSQGVSLGDSNAYGENINTVHSYKNGVIDKELDEVRNVMEALDDYRNKNWAIGLNGDTLEPDQFMIFFASRGLPFASYVRSQGVSVGDSDAYGKNIATLENYASSLDESR